MGRRGRQVLAAVVVVLVGLVGAEVWYLSSGPSASSEGRPVVIGDLEARAIVDEAAQSLTEITSTSFHNYDDQVSQATTLMSPEFAERYRATADSLRPTFMDRRREIAAQVVASGVVRATDNQVQALVFLDSRISERGSEPVTLPYRTLVTMTRSGHDWLVSEIETK
jgi:Mce-associated membrane protein